MYGLKKVLVSLIGIDSPKKIIINLFILWVKVRDQIN